MTATIFGSSQKLWTKRNTLKIPEYHHRPNQPNSCDQSFPTTTENCSVQTFNLKSFPPRQGESTWRGINRNLELHCTAGANGSRLCFVFEILGNCTLDLEKYKPMKIRKKQALVPRTKHKMFVNFSQSSTFRGKNSRAKLSVSDSFCFRLNVKEEVCIFPIRKNFEAQS
jgi:hypothetical protein